MATVKVIEPKPVKQPPKRIVLELSEGEADFVLAMSGIVTGSPKHSPRKYADRIFRELSAALGVNGEDTDAYKLMKPGAFSFLMPCVHMNNYERR